MSGLPVVLVWGLVVVALSSACSPGPGHVSDDHDSVEVTGGRLADHRNAELSWDIEFLAGIESFQDIELDGDFSNADETEFPGDAGSEGDVRGDAETQGDGADADAESEVVAPPPVPVLPAVVALDEYGGMADLPVAEETGYFATGILGGRAWLVDPAGKAFFSLGVQAVGFGSLSSPALGYAPGTLAQYAALAEQYTEQGQIPAAVATEQVTAMHEAGFNSVGGWSGGIWNSSAFKMPYSVNLGFAGGVQGVEHAVPAVSEGGFPDVFHPDFPTACLEYAQAAVPKECVEDPLNIGYYLDNELRWWGKGYFIESKTWTLADDFIDEAPGTPAKSAVIAWFQERYSGDIEAFNATYGLALEGFPELADVTKLPLDPDNAAQVADREGVVRLIAEAYFAGTNDGLKLADPNHLNLCVRVASVAPAPVFEMAGKYCDVVTVNDYYTQSDPITDLALGGIPEERWAAMATLALDAGGPKPFVLAEWGERGDDSGLPNTYGAGKVVATQQDRAEYYLWSLDWLLDREAEGIGYVSGAHWFMYTDEPATGRFDGEDGNYGVVTIRGEKYRWLWSAMAAANRAILSRLAAGVVPTVLHPPALKNIKAVPGDDGTLALEFPAVPNADAYRFSLLTHPAGIENRMVAGTETDVEPDAGCRSGQGECGPIEAVLPLQGIGSGLAWVAVECRSQDLLAFGATVVGPFLVVDESPVSLEEVLACESISPVTSQNELPQPNDAAGQSYARLVPSFLEEKFGNALEIELVPSSLGFVKHGGSGQVAASLSLPEALEIPAGGMLELSVLPAHVMDTTGKLGPSTRFVRIQAMGQGGTVLVEWELAQLELQPGVAGTVQLPAAEAVKLSGLRFVVPLATPKLPMDQVVRITLDEIAVVP